MLFAGGRRRDGRPKKLTFQALTPLSARIMNMVKSNESMLVDGWAPLVKALEPSQVKA